MIVQTANSSLETVVTAMRHGAADFFVKPVAPERLIISLRNALKLDELETIVRTDRSRRAGTLGITDIVTRAPAMDRVLRSAPRPRSRTIPVLIEGETGVGKELVARVIQGAGDRAGKPFVTVNCGAIPANLVESTLFGHKKGAFTGAIADQAGKFAEAHGGTIFLDEVGELPLETQVKLLRVIQQGEIEPVGADESMRVNVRVISATNRRLLNLAKSGAFREDLYYRLNVFPIYVPPLRERTEDIPVLVNHFIARLAAEAGKRVVGISRAGAGAAASGYNWPGNIRQLENAVYRAVVLTRQRLSRDRRLPADRRADRRSRRSAAADREPADPFSARFISTTLPLACVKHEQAEAISRPVSRRQRAKSRPSPISSATSSSLPCVTTAAACRGSRGRWGSGARRSTASCGNTVSTRGSRATRPRA